ncbi:hypothetical protein Pmani_011756 [Petrolisthes manimaculis]|uniref:Major facilitator superfamily associated domain-containing protein n=1 Tax=Petrolisthes manimaculis TaxID=1843537 RepID=A0AAE1Q1U1_9EUCA|nr:hypothetical protein Pmani_011756 [Petrolisthes manimaculis]
MVKQHNSDFGKQRVLSTIGQATIPLLSGVLVDWHSSSIGYSDYGPTVYMGTGLTLLASLIILRLNVKVDISKQDVFKDLMRLISMVEVNLFLLIIMVMGSNHGFIENYLFLYLKELNAPTYLLGLTLTVGCMAAVPVMYVADAVVKKLGRPLIFMLSFFCYSIRHIGYSYIIDPWMVFPFELLEVFTYQITWVAACTLCPILAPKGLLATMTGLTGSLHYSVGRGLGALLGGYLIGAFGLVKSFRIFAVISLVSGFVYVGIHFLFLKKRLEAKEAEREAELEEDRRKQEEEELQPMINTSSRRPSLQM